MAVHSKNGNKKLTAKQWKVNIDDLDVNVLQERLDRLLIELESCKSTCEKYKTENAEYRNGIEAVDKDNHEYVHYLQSKKAEKQEAIEQLSSTGMKDMEKFNSTKQELRKKHENQISSLNIEISELASKLSLKKKQFSDLQTIVEKRAKHNAEMALIKAEADEATADYEAKITKLEDDLVKQRMALQVASEQKIEAIKRQADEKAVECLSEHCLNITNENRALEKELAELTISTTKLTEKKEKLRQSVLELEREKSVKSGVVVARMKRIDHAEKRRLKEKGLKKAERAQKHMELAKLLLAKPQGAILAENDLARLGFSDSDCD